MTNNFRETAIELLKSAGSRVTKPRIAVIECLSRESRPLTAKEIFDGVEDIDQASVYRILETLSALGLIHQVFPSGGFLACHHANCVSRIHVLLHCEKCEQTSEIHVPRDSINPLFRFLEREQGFVPEKHVMQLNGVCQNCSA